MIVIFVFIGFAVVAYILLHGNIESLSQMLKEQTGDNSDDEDLVRADSEETDEEGIEVENKEDENENSFDAEIDYDILNDDYNEPGLTSEEEDIYGVELTELNLSPNIESEYMSYHSGKMISDLQEDTNEKTLQMVIFDQVYQSR